MIGAAGSRFVGCALRAAAVTDVAVAGATGGVSTGGGAALGGAAGMAAGWASTVGSAGAGERRTITNAATPRIATAATAIQSPFFDFP